MAEKKNAGKFTVGTRFIGNVNHLLMEVVDIRNKWEGTVHIDSMPEKTIAVVKAYPNAGISTIDLNTLEYCDVTIVPRNKEAMLSRDGKKAGLVESRQIRYCAACQGMHSCYLVRWTDGTTTKPCTAGVREIVPGVLIIK